MKLPFLIHPFGLVSVLHSQASRCGYVPLVKRSCPLTFPLASEGSFDVCCATHQYKEAARLQWEPAFHPLADRILIVL